MKKLLPLLLLTITPAFAHPPVDSPSLRFLPPEGQVVDLLDQDPGVRRAGALLTAAQAEARGRAVGPHEFTAHGEYVTRSTNLEGRLNEWTAGVSRGIRLPGKAEADRRIGASGVDVAENGLGDARHVAALSLKNLWMAWLVAESDARQSEAEVAAYERQLSVTTRGHQLGQSATLQVEQVQAALSQARALAAQATQARLDAKMTLQRSFPALTLPVSPPVMPEPKEPPGIWEDWRKAVLEDNHEIKQARSEAERRDWLAKRARLDRFADPTFDLRTFQERGGHETGFGIGFSVPIGGALRSATSDQTAAEAAAASVAAHRVQREVEIIAERDVIGAQQGLEAWRQNQAAAQSSATMLARMQRAVELGDQGITELLIARRQDYDMRRSEARARAAAHGAVLQLLIDSHRVWGLGDEE